MSFILDNTVKFTRKEAEEQIKYHKERIKFWRTLLRKKKK